MGQSFASDLMGQTPSVAYTGFRQAETSLELADEVFDPLANALQQFKPLLAFVHVSAHRRL